MNKNCADKWLKDRNHLNNCVCLEKEAREICSWFTKSLQESKKSLRNCKCKKSKKVRVGDDYYSWCEICEKNISVASKKRVIKNRNDPRF